MRLQKSALGILINFLLGVAWAFVLIGALYTFFSYYQIGFFSSIMMSFLGALPGLFFVILLEYLIVGMERLEELKKQTSLLEKLLRQNQQTALDKEETDRS